MFRGFMLFMRHRSQEISVGCAWSLWHVRHKKCNQSRKNQLGVFELNKGAGVKPVVYMRMTIHKISNILRFSTWHSAKEELESLCIEWDSYTVNQVLKTHPPMEKAWLFFNWCSHLKGFKHDQFTYTTMMDIFGEAGRIEAMNYLFHQMEETGLRIDAVTYTSLLHWLSSSGDIDGALCGWKKMKKAGCLPTVVSYTALMKVLFNHGRPKEAASVYKEMIEAGWPPNHYTYTVLIEYLASSGKFREAFEILCKMQNSRIRPDKVACNILVQKCSKAREMHVLTQTLEYMKEHFLVLRRPIYFEALESLKYSGESDKLLNEVHPHLCCGEYDDCGRDPPAITHVHIDRGIFIDMIERHNFVAVEYLIKGMIQKNVKLETEFLSSIMMTFCSNQRHSGALMVLKYSSMLGLQLQRDAYVCLVGLSLRMNLYDNLMEVVEEMVRRGVYFGTYLGSLLIYHFGSAGMFASSESIFSSLHGEHNTVTYTALMYAYIKSANFEKALDLYRKMSQKQVPAASGTYQILKIGLQGSGSYCKDESFIQPQMLSGLQHNVLWQQRLCDILFDNETK